MVRGARRAHGPVLVAPGLVVAPARPHRRAALAARPRSAAKRPLDDDEHHGHANVGRCGCGLDLDLEPGDRRFPARAVRRRDG